jgi:hypothetical protein
VPKGEVVGEVVRSPRIRIAHIDDWRLVIDLRRAARVDRVVADDPVRVHQRAVGKATDAVSFDFAHSPHPRRTEEARQLRRTVSADGGQRAGIHVVEKRLHLSRIERSVVNEHIIEATLEVVARIVNRTPVSEEQVGDLERVAHDVRTFSGTPLM